jgi:hypothetical protein
MGRLKRRIREESANNFLVPAKPFSKGIHHSSVNYKCVEIP